LLQGVVHVLNGKDDSPRSIAVLIGVGDKDVFEDVDPVDEAADGTVVLKSIDLADFQRLVVVIRREVVDVRLVRVIEIELR
jgi:hypothetical protein